MPTWIPAKRLKLDGLPADETMARIPPSAGVGSLMTAPSIGEMIVEPLMPSGSPNCRFVLPVRVVMGPIVMLPWVEFEAMQAGCALLAAANIAGSSTGQRKNGVQSNGPTWNVWSGPVTVPAEVVATTWKGEKGPTVSPAPSARPARNTKPEPRSAGEHGTLAAFVYPLMRKSALSTYWKVQVVSFPSGTIPALRVSLVRPACVADSADMNGAPALRGP